jgi:hypothetical protein
MAIMRSVTMLSLARDALERALMTQMRPKPICRNDWSTTGSFARLSLKLRSNTKRLLLVRNRLPEPAFFQRALSRLRLIETENFPCPLPHWRPW